MDSYSDHFVIRSISLNRNDLIALESLMDELVFSALERGEKVSSWVEASYKDAEFTKPHLKDLPDVVEAGKLKTLSVSKLTNTRDLLPGATKVRFSYSRVSSSINLFVSGKDRLWVQGAKAVLKKHFKEKQTWVDKVRPVIDSITLLLAALPSAAAMNALTTGNLWLFLVFFLAALGMVAVQLFKFIGLLLGGGNVQVTFRQTDKQKSGLDISLTLLAVSVVVAILSLAYMTFLG